MHLLCSESLYIQYNAQRTVHENDHTKTKKNKKKTQLSQEKKKEKKQRKEHMI